MELLSMPSRYDDDLRKKAIEAVKRGERKVDVYKMFNISPSTLDRWLKEDLEILESQQENKHDEIFRKDTYTSSQNPSSDFGFLQGCFFAFVAAVAFLVIIPKGEVEGVNLQSQNTYEGIIDARSLNSESANVRDTPGIDGRRIATVKNGIKVIFTKEKESEGWLNVTLSDGKVGWMASNLVKNRKKVAT